MAHRTFTDRQGRAWDAWEVHPTLAERRELTPDESVVVERRKRGQPRASLPREMRHGWLTFESNSERRRLAPTPDGWEAMSDAELAALLELAVPAGIVRRLIE